MINNNNDLCYKYKYKDLIFKQIIEELKPTEENLRLMRDRLNKANLDELEKVYEAFERFGVKSILETVK